jgi:hypothetical protein
VRCAAAKPHVNAEKPRFFINALNKKQKFKTTLPTAQQ